MVFHRTLPTEILEGIVSALRTIRDETFTPLINDVKTETKDVDPHSIANMAYAFGSNRLIFPSRVLDSFILEGNPEVLLSAKAKLIAECAGPEGKRIIEHLRARRRRTKSSMLSGVQKWKGENLAHYNLKTGVAYFDNVSKCGEEPVQLRSFKSGPLRYVQVSLEKDIIALIRGLSSGDKSRVASKILANLPTPTVDKIEFLSDMGVLRLTRTDVLDLVDCYIAFLQLYHISEKSFKDGSTTSTFDIKEVTERIDLLVTLLDKTILKEEEA